MQLPKKVEILDRKDLLQGGINLIRCIRFPICIANQLKRITCNYDAIT